MPQWTEFTENHRAYITEPFSHRPTASENAEQTSWIHDSGADEYCVARRETAGDCKRNRAAFKTIEKIDINLIRQQKLFTASNKVQQKSEDKIWSWRWRKFAGLQIAAIELRRKLFIQIGDYK